MSQDKMIRKQIYIEPRQNEKVKMVSMRQGKTEAEIIREAIDQYVISESITKDPLSELIGIVHTEDRSGSILHDVDIHRLEEEQ